MKRTLNMVTDTFLVLVPHRDARLPLRAWSASLFAAGLPGAWSFPWVTPLALLRRPLSRDELKGIARALREYINLCGGKFIAGPQVAVALHTGNNGINTSIFGPVLQTGLPDGFFEPAAGAVQNRFSPPVIGSALVKDTDSTTLPSPPEISFRAAALANMSFHPLSPDGYSFEWKIGALYWLPKKGSTNYAN